MFLREAARPVSRTREMHFAHTHIHPHIHVRTCLSPVPFVAPSLHFFLPFFFFFLRTAPPDATFLYSHLLFILAGEYHPDVSPNWRGNETTRSSLGSLVTRVRRLKGTRTRVAPTAKKSLDRDGIRDSESRLAKLKVQKGTICVRALKLKLHS